MIGIKIFLKNKNHKYGCDRDKSLSKGAKLRLAEYRKGYYKMQKKYELHIKKALNYLFTQTAKISFLKNVLSKIGGPSYQFFQMDLESMFFQESITNFGWLGFFAKYKKF